MALPSLVRALTTTWPTLYNALAMQQLYSDMALNARKLD